MAMKPFMRYCADDKFCSQFLKRDNSMDVKSLGTILE